MTMTVSITLYGEISKDPEDWEKWYFDSKKICELLGYQANYFAIIGENIANDRIRTIKRSERKLLKLLKEKEKVDILAVYVIPKNFTSAITDYMVTISRGENCVTLVMQKKKYMEIDPNVYIKILNKHINMEYGEIYEMAINEFPEMYASKANDPSFYKTLRIIKKLHKEELNI
ncbi:hypothetical protein [Defluviitalea phaphyphila]|uniref:hypothetical protein n=1 Tax=Defluviitalea phaphyphila TaxID=1473580 RepID=UPI00073084BA|nr:hypothetical protein [Defluviitalea phaphyphila]